MATPRGPSIAIAGDAAADVDALRAGVQRVGLQVLHPLIAAVLHDVEFVLAGPMPGGVLAVIGWLDAIEHKQRRRRRGR